MLILLDPLGMEGEGKSRKSAGEVSKMSLGSGAENTGVFGKGGNAKMVVKE